MKIEAYIQKELFALQDKEYHDFHCRLMPTVNPDVVIGVRTPALRKFAKEVAKMPEAEVFLQKLPHTYYEENNLHGFLLENIRDYEKCVNAVDAFLPYVDNWATCDMMTPKIFKQHPEELLTQIRRWLSAEDTYAVRFAIRMLMNFYLDELFTPEYPRMVADVESEEYYINMMIAWYFSTALAKQYDAVIPYLEKRQLPQWIHNKTIQKAIESYRITNEQKTYLRTLKG